MFKNFILKRNQFFDLAAEMYFVKNCRIIDISRKFSIPESTIRGWLRIFAEANGIEMKPRKYVRRSLNKVNVSLSNLDSSSRERALLSEIKRLEKALRSEQLRADLNEEIINVAEQKFNIKIRKKAGAKQ